MLPLRDRVLALYGAQSRLSRCLLGTRFLALPLREIDEALPSDATIVELGCGQGVLSNYLKLSQPGRTILGVEYSRERLAVARRSVGERTGIAFEFGDIATPGAVRGWRGSTACVHVLISQVLYLLSEEQERVLLGGLSECLRHDDVLWVVDYTTRPWHKWAWLRVENAVLTASVAAARRLRKGMLTGAFGARSALARIPSMSGWRALFSSTGWDCSEVPCRTRTPFPQVFFRCSIIRKTGR